MPRKIVGITCNTANATEKAGPRQTLNQAYLRAVERAGATPIILPVTLDAEAPARYLSFIDGLLLSGGVDIAPACYGQEPHPQLGEIDPARDAVELLLTHAALDADMPIFAICRGIQTLNVALGGTLYQDLPSERPSDLFHEQTDLQIPRDQTVHVIQIDPDSRLRSIVGADEMQTNSMHHQALKDVAPGLVVTARAADSVIEAVEMPERRYVVAVQFHPEETAPHDAQSRRLFEDFVAALS